MTRGRPALDGDHAAELLFEPVGPVEPAVDLGYPRQLDLLTVVRSLGFFHSAKRER